jgi:hypothetical protein
METFSCPYRVQALPGIYKYKDRAEAKDNSLGCIKKKKKYNFTL